MLRRIARDPLTHFLAIGLFLFVLYGAVGGRSDQQSIRVDDNVAAALYSQFRNTWQRPPTPAEMSNLVNAYVREEIFYREGVALGLDRDDPTIKRRVSQKFTTIAEEGDSAKGPSDNELNGWLSRHAARYSARALVTFDQIGFDPAQLDGPSALVMASARASLAAGTDPQSLGTMRMLEPSFERYPLEAVERDFGISFAQALLAVEPGKWEGPIQSGHGIHLVRVQKVVPGRIPALNDVRAAVARDYEAARRARTAEATYRKLLGDYRIEYSGAWKTAQQQ